MAADEMIELALRQAHIPSLLVTLAHLTGRTDLLREDWRPKYLPHVDQHTGGLSEETLAELRDVARAMLPALVAKARAATPDRSALDLHALMDFIAGTKIPARYLPLLEDELGLNIQTVE